MNLLNRLFRNKKNTSKVVGYEIVTHSTSIPIRLPHSIAVLDTHIVKTLGRSLNTGKEIKNTKFNRMLIRFNIITIMPY